MLHLPSHYRRVVCWSSSSGGSADGQAIPPSRNPYEPASGLGIRGQTVLDRRPRHRLAPQGLHAGMDLRRLHRAIGIAQNLGCRGEYGGELPLAHRRRRWLWPSLRRQLLELGQQPPYPVQGFSVGVGPDEAHSVEAPQWRDFWRFGDWWRLAGCWREYQRGVPISPARDTPRSGRVDTGIRFL